MSIGALLGSLWGTAVLQPSILPLLYGVPIGLLLVAIVSAYHHPFISL